MKTVLIVTRTFGKYTSEPIDLLKNNGFDLLWSDSLNPDLLRRADAIILGTGKLTGEMIENSSLKIIARHGVGVDNVDLKKATDLGIPVTITPNANTVSVAELVIGLIFVLSRRLVDVHNELFEKRKFSSSVGIEVLGKTLGVIGFGAIGRETAKRGLCLGMRVLAYDPYVSREVIHQYSVEQVDLETLLKTSDFVSLHLPLNQTTRKMIGKREIQMMKKTAFLINTSRGGIVDENALVEALKENQIAGAAFDAFEVEPLPEDSVLYNCPKLILTPHIGAHTYEAIYRMNMMASQAVVDFFNKKLPQHIVNVEIVDRLLKQGFSH
ncbi:MAG TPA: phosphoglycerate dehydrogenase [Pseudothermotoga sp.]|nr:phosphoglycerate dehydrogenase [Pseudothermotoga sp.]HOK83527.1 phosphoglycerate dehydrogenase [Pseudothermotoga sp.]HPP69600.1 phosphoglycerate dehydrogenase [Pseudothermotoga sp.]